MKVTVITGGSRGDVQPYLALGKELKSREHEVTIQTYPFYEDEVAGNGLGFYRLTGDPQAIVSSLLKAGNNPVAYAREFRKATEPTLRDNLDETLSACEGADVIVQATVGALGYIVGKELNIPVVGAGFQPLFSITGEFPSSVILGGIPISSSYNRFSYRLTRQLFWQTLWPSLSPIVREKFGGTQLPMFGPFSGIDDGSIPCLYGWSPELLPQPEGWGNWTKVTGFWFTKSQLNWTPPADLVEFLENSTRTIAIGFSSLSFGNNQQLISALDHAVSSLGLKAVLLTGWSELGNYYVSNNLYVIDEAPHEWLLSKSQAFVQHGGLGSLAAALRARIPVVSIPHSADQRFWAARAWGKGLSMRPLNPRQLSSEKLADAIFHAIADSEIRERAENIGEKVNMEDGVGVAAEVLEDWTERMGS